MSHYNNIYNKKNVEFEIDGDKRTLPYNTAQEVTLKANQIVFSSINNIFQKLLDNDLYNESLLRKYIEYGIIGGPTYVSSIANVENDPSLGKKFVVSGENGISVLRKEETPVEDTLSGRFLDGFSVNKLDFINQHYIACTNNGIYESENKIDWTYVIGENSDIVDICYNYNFLKNNLISTFDYIAVCNRNQNAVFFGHDGIENTWKSFEANNILSAISISGVIPNSIFSFDEDAKTYVGTNRGLFASELTAVKDDLFLEEIGTSRWKVVNMAKIPNADEFEEYLLGTPFGIKQSHKSYGFKNLTKVMRKDYFIYDAIEYNGCYYLATGVGLVKMQDEIVKYVDSLYGIQCYALLQSDNKLYVGTSNGICIVNENDVVTSRSLEGNCIFKLAILNELIFASSLDTVYYSNNFFNWNTLVNGISVKQLKTNNNTLYVVESNKIQAFSEENYQNEFLWKNTSFAGSRTIQFAKNVSNSIVLFQVNNEVVALDSLSENSEKFKISLGTYGNVSDACLINGSYYIVTSENNLLSVNLSLSALEKIDTGVKKIIAYNNPAYQQFSGLWKLKTDNKIYVNDNPINNNSYKDIAKNNSIPYAIESDGKTICLFSVIVSETLAKEEDDANLVSFKTLMFNNKQMTVSAYKNKVEIEYDGQSYLIDENDDPNDIGVKIGAENNEIIDVDVIDYVENCNNRKTILISTSSYLYYFDVFLNDGVLIIEYQDRNLALSIKEFADIYYTDEFGTLSGANFLIVKSKVGDNYYFLSKNEISSYIVEHQRIDNSLNFSSQIHNAAVVNGNVVLGTSDGIYGLDNQNFLTNVAFSGQDVKNIKQIDDDTVIAVGNENNVLVSADANSNRVYQIWNSIYNQLDNEFDGVSANYADVFRTSVSTLDISNLKENREKIEQSNFISNADNFQLNNLSYVYKYNNAIYLVDINNDCYKLTKAATAGNYNVEKQFEQPKTLDYVYENKKVNSFVITADKLSLDYDAGIPLTDAISYDNDIRVDRVRITPSCSITADNEDVVLFNETKEIGNYIQIKFSAESAHLDIDASKSTGIDSVTLTGSFIILANIEYGNYEFTELSDINDTGEAISVYNQNGEYTDIIIYPEEKMSAFVYQRKNETVEKRFSIGNDEGDIVLNEGNNLSISYDFDANDLEQNLSIDYSEYELLGINYQFVIGAKSINGETNSQLSVECKSLIDYNLSVSKSVSLLPLRETIDNIYYDNVLDGNNIFNCFIVPFNNNGGYLMFDGFDLYFIGNNDLISTNRNVQLAFVQISKTENNDNFNDLYYFDIEQNSLRNSSIIKKTKITQHDADFSDAKEDEAIGGNITKIAVENKNNGMVFVKNGNDISYTSSSLFPNFMTRALNNGQIDDFASSRTQTYFVRTNEDNAKNIYSYIVNNENQLILQPINTSSYGNISSVFTNNDSVYFQTNIGFYKNPSNPEQILEYRDYYTNDLIKAYYHDDNSNKKILITDAAVNVNERRLNFRSKLSSNYTYENNTVGIKNMLAVNQNTVAACLLLAADNYIYRINVTDLSRKNVFGDGFRNIKLMCLDFSGSLLVFDENGLWTFPDFNELTSLNDSKLSSYSYNVDPENYLSGDYKKAVTSYKGISPAIIDNGNIYGLETSPKIEVTGEKKFDSNVNFIQSLNSAVEKTYIQSSSNCISNIVENVNQIEVEKVRDNIVVNGLDRIDINSSNMHTILWNVNRDRNYLSVVDLDDDSNPPTTYNVNSTMINGICRINSNPYLATNDGLYELNKTTLFGENLNDVIYKRANALIGCEFFSLEFLNEDYIFNYLSSISKTSKISKFASSKSDVESYLNDCFFSYEGCDTLELMFRKYLFAATKNSDGFVCDLSKLEGKELSYSQLKRNNNGYASQLLFVKELGSNFGCVGYGNSFNTFSGFDFNRTFENPSSKYIALANNFKNSINVIKVVNDNPDFLIGTEHGLKYVYNDIMTRSFYDKDSNTNISKNVNAICKVNVAENDGYYAIGQENVLYAVTNLSMAKFQKLLEFPENETITDIYSIQKNEYVIATTKGVYITKLNYTIINDLTKITIEQIYGIVNDNIKKIIEKHVKALHSKNSLIFKVNEKASNRLTFISKEDLHNDIYDTSMADGIRIVKNDVIDSITYGGQSSDDQNNYVKVGISNWALNSMSTTNTYADSNFVTGFTDPSSGKTFDISVVPYVVKKWKSGVKEIYIYVPTTGTYYMNNPQGISNSKYSMNVISRRNVNGRSAVNILQDSCTTLRVYLYNSYFDIKTIIAAQCVGNSLPLKIYKDNVNAEEEWKGVFDAVIEPSALRTLPISNGVNVNNITSMTDEFGRIYLDFSVYGTDSQAIRIIAE